MIIAHIVNEGFSEDLIGVQELAALPSIGTIITVLDRNSNLHRIKVSSIELFALSTDEERRQMQVATSGETRVRITGTNIMTNTHTDWAREEIASRHPELVSGSSSRQRAIIRRGRMDAETSSA